MSTPVVVPVAPAAPAVPVATTTTVSTPVKPQGFFGRMKARADRNPWLAIRRVLWILLAGIPLGLLFLAAALAFAVTIIGLPVAWELLKLARFAFLPVGYKAVPRSARGKNPLRNPKSPLTIAANIVWAVFFGIPLSVLLLFVCVIQALTIIGIPSALQFPKLALFALWPIGKKIVSKQKYKANKQARRDLATAEAVRRNEAAALAATTPMERV
jgi:uncharacterized membrane protein YccF (DUF307 family)